MKWWQIRKAISGYGKRNRVAWETARWHSWTILCALGAKLDSPTNLVKFAWDAESIKDKSDEELTDEEIDELQRIMREENEK